MMEADVYMKIVNDTARMIIGSYVFIGRGTEFDIKEELVIGDHTIIAPNCFITDHRHGISAHSRIDQQACDSGKVSIGSDVSVGNRCCCAA